MLQRLAVGLPVSHGGNFEDLLVHDESHQVENMDAKAHDHRAAAHGFRVLPPAAQAGTGFVFGFASLASAPVPLQQPDTAQSALGYQITGQQMGRMEAQFEPQAQLHAVGLAYLDHGQSIVN